MLRPSAFILRCGRLAVNAPAGELEGGEQIVKVTPQDQDVRVRTITIVRADA